MKNRIATTLKNNFKKRYKLTTAYQDSPIFIVGSGRSGNTLVRRILINEPSIYIPPETYVLGQLIKEFQVHSKSEWSFLIRLVLSQLSLSEDFHYFPTPYLRPLYMKLVDMSIEKRSLSTILNEFYLFMANIVKPGVTRWGDKTPLNTASIFDIYEVFPNAQFVHLVRNVHDVCSSYVKMGRYKTFKEAAIRWRDSNNSVEKFKRTTKARIRMFKYEDLVADPEAQVKELCKFLNLSYSPSLLTNIPESSVLGDSNVSHYSNVHKAISPKSVGIANRELDKGLLRELTVIAGPLIDLYGYSETIRSD